MSNVRMYYNCLVLKNHKFMKDNLWVKDGKIVNPESVNYNFDESIDCRGALLAPGLIDLKINGKNEIDFSSSNDIATDLSNVAKSLVRSGVTAFCPTITSSKVEYYHKTLPLIKKREGSVENGASVLGVHLDGPFISKEKSGAHLEQYIQSEDASLEAMKNVYGDLSNVAIITMAPELKNAIQTIKALSKMNIRVSLGHSTCSLAIAEQAVKADANMVTHLFNGMPAFHHRDPSLVGLLASNSSPNVYFSLIADGVHTHRAALKMAYRIKPERIFLISDGIAESVDKLGDVQITAHNDPKQQSSYYTVKNTNILCGGASTLDACVRSMNSSTNCSIIYALEAASLHPARAFGISDTHGKLDFGYTADFILLNPDTYIVEATYIKGQLVYDSNSS